MLAENLEVLNPPVELEYSPPTLTPWQENPYQLLSWWDMQQISAQTLYWTGYLLESLKTDCLLKPGVGDTQFAVGLLYQPLDQKTFDKALKSLRIIEEQCASVGMQVTAGTIHDVIQKLESETKQEYEWLMNQTSAIQKMMQKEMQGKLFLYITPERARFWPRTNAPNLFGVEVSSAFPSTTYDISEAGICLAVARETLI